MKKQIILVSKFMAMFVILLSLLSCLQPKNKAAKEGKSDTISSALSQKQLIKKNARLVDQSILDFVCLTHLDKKLAAWHGHCCLYANSKEKSFFILPKHALPYDKRMDYELYVVNYKNDTTPLTIAQAAYSSIYDAMVLETQKITGAFPLSSSSLITGKKESQGDSIMIVAPFNSRGVRQKPGLVIADNDVQMDFFLGEPGDSGSPIVNQNGVIGIVSSVDPSGKKVNYVPISVFENIYGQMVLQENK